VANIQQLLIGVLKWSGLTQPVPQSSSHHNEEQEGVLMVNVFNPNYSV